MKKSTRNKILKQIERLCEKQYRKGVQHGSLLPSMKEANAFRDHGMQNGYRTHEWALGPGKDEPYIDRLMAECSMEDMAELAMFLNGQMIPE